MSLVSEVMGFVVAWLVSTLAIWLALKIFPGKQKRESLAGAAVTALAGGLIYWIFHAVIRIPLISGVVAFFVWLYALRKLQGVGWLGALGLAILIWIINGILSLFLPTLKL
jgi:inner membrane protein involved in colicin E2 resistance